MRRRRPAIHLVVTPEERDEIARLAAALRSDWEPDDPAVQALAEYLRPIRTRAAVKAAYALRIRSRPLFHKALRDLIGEGSP